MISSRAISILVALPAFFCSHCAISQEPVSDLTRIFSDVPRSWELNGDLTTTPPEPWVWHLRPQGTLYHTYWASAQESRLGTQIVGTDEGTFQDSSIGGRVGILKFGPRYSDQGFQLDILGGAKLRQDWDEGLDVLSSDFRYDILGTYSEGAHRWKFGFYHISAHTGDEFLIKNPDFKRKNFFRDVLVLGYSYFPTPELRLYSEIGWGVDTEFSEPWELQFGIDYGPASPTGNFGAPFFAMNAHLREELDFGGNLAAQAGWAWRGEAIGDGVLRTGGYLYEGGSPHQAFFDQHETQVGWGLWYDY